MKEIRLLLIAILVPFAYAQELNGAHFTCERMPFLLFMNSSACADGAEKNNKSACCDSQSALMDLRTPVSTTEPVSSSYWLPDVHGANDPGSKNDETSRYSTGIVPSTLVIEPDTFKPWRTVDRKFIMLNGLSALAAVADLETTARGLATTNASELNPLFGRHPSQIRVYAEGASFQSLLILFNYSLKKRGPRRKTWESAVYLTIVAHSAATIGNLLVIKSAH